MEENKEKERRRFQRIDAELRVELRHLGRSGESFADVTRDVSEGGLFVETSVALEVGTIVSVEILPTKGAQPIRLDAEVVRVEEEAGAKHSKKIKRVQGMALKFVNREQDEVTRLMDLTRRVGEYLSGNNG